ncbi:MAG: sugar-binding protein [Planctomycetota bacterium]
MFEHRNAVCAAALLAVSAVCAGDARVVNLYDVQRTDKAPAIDGKLDDECWRNRPEITNMVLRGAATRVPARVQTHTTLLYDDQALYVAIKLDEPNPQGLRKNYVQYDGQLWWDDSVELYIETGCSHQEYFKLMSNALGTRADWRGKNTPMGFQMFDWGTGAEWTVGAHVGADFWSLEFRIPWSDLETPPPQPGTVWTFEVVRFRYAEGGGKNEYSSWNVGATHDKPGNFGNIVFSGTSAELEKMIVANLKPVFGGAVKMYGREGELRYTDYATLKQERLAAVRANLQGLRAKLAGLGETLDPATRKPVQEQLAAREKGLAELDGAPASAATAEALDKLNESCAPILWTLKYHELNAHLGPAAPKP